MGRTMRRMGGPLPLLLSLGVALCAATCTLRTAFITTQSVPTSPPLIARSARKATGDELVPPKRPASSYMSWLNDNRESIVEKLGTNSVTLVAKEAGQQWKKLSAAKKKPYEAAWVKAKAKYAKDLEDFKAAGGVILKPEKRTSRTRSTRAKRDPNMPKRPLSSYMLWLQDNRASIVKSMPAGHKVTDVMREAGAQWSKLTAAKKKKYEKAAADAKAKYLEEMEEYKAES
ncbi:unnamed protein product [Cladocopium goreaui]|uniref:HMG box domain-containing protein n=1 Tax=Cladocopium goreaui TaxID=2562237 RepID=A0A9P1DB88_9DINO|nr:unnamed protein product [Cladocopium goreaui]